MTGVLELRDGSGRRIAEVVSTQREWEIKPKVPQVELKRSGLLDLYENGTRLTVAEGVNEREVYVSVNLCAGTQRFSVDKQGTLVGVLGPRLKRTLTGLGSAGTQAVEYGPIQFKFI